MLTPEEIYNSIRSYTEHVSYERICEAYMFALKKHGTQLRESGEPYITHPINVAQILIELNLDEEAIVAAILHDTLEDTATTYDELCQKFGNKIAYLVNGVTKLTNYDNQSIQHGQESSYIKLLLASAEDIRVLIIKLADRLHNIRTIQHKRKRSKRIFIANETLNVYAPLSDRIGLTKIKNELQDRAFMELDHDKHNLLNSILNQKYKDEESVITQIKNELYQIISKISSNCSITGRIKTPYSIWKKLKSKNISIDNLSDIMGFRIIVDTVSQCYDVLGEIHKKYKVVPRRFKDYISSPKQNHYQSLHTNVIGTTGQIIEIQIRTKEMNEIAEYGIASHWKYKYEHKELTNKDDIFIQNINDIINNQQDIEKFLSNTQNIFANSVFCITPKGLIVSLPIGSSILDFAYAIHTDIGNHAYKAVVNGIETTLNTIISNGDQIDIVTKKDCSPRKEWLIFAKTKKAINAINQELNSLNKYTAELIGKSILDNISSNSKHQIKIDDLLLQKLTLYFNCLNVSKLLFLLATSSITTQEIIDALKQITKKDIKCTNQHNDSQQITASLFYGLPKDVQICHASCCTPIPGDRVVLFSISKNKYELHIEECQCNEAKTICSNGVMYRPTWKDEAFTEKIYIVKLYITVKKSSGVLYNINKVVTNYESKIVMILNYQESANKATVLIGIEIINIIQLVNIISALNQISGIEQIARYPKFIS